MKPISANSRSIVGIAGSVALAMVLLGMEPVRAATVVKTVRFDAGASSATISGSLKGYDTVKYKLGARAGQVMSILFAPKHLSCYFNVIAPGEDVVAVHRGDVDGNEFAANLKVTGDYTAEIYLMRSAARRGEVCKFAITFEITGP